MLDRIGENQKLHRLFLHKGGKYMKMSKDKQIDNEVRRIKDILKDIDSDRMNINEKLIQNVAFMSVTLLELQEKVKKEGAVIKSTNGNGFEVLNEHPAQKSYNTMINRFTSAMKQLTDLLPKGEVNSDNDDGFEDFINSK